MSEMNLTAVLEEYALAAPVGNDRQTLKQMIERYPQFAEELKDFAAARAVIKYAPEPEISVEEAAHYKEIGMQSLRAVLAETSASQPADLQSLTDAAKAKGMNRSKFAAAIGLSVSLVQYLEKRRLDYASIPKTIISKVAEVLGTGEEFVTNYLNQAPNLVTNASYKATERPEELQPKSFAEAISEDQQLSAEDKRRLLDLTK